MPISRREILAGTAALCVTAPTLLKSAFASSSEPLAKTAEKKGILFGTAVRGEALRETAYADLVAEQCRIGVPEGALKWDSLRPTPDRYDFGPGDYYYQFLSSHGMKYRGHALVWEQALPKWFGSVVNAQNAKKMMLDHISTVVRHYAGKMHSWDVINEVLKIEDGRADGLKSTPWLQMIGPEYIEMALHAAHEADPKAMLVYNENWLEPEDRGTDRKRQAALSLLTGLKKKGAPIHGLGIQSHLFAETIVGGPSFDRFLKQVADLGMEILITELDIRDQHLPAGIPARDQAVAKQYSNYLAFMLQHKSVRTVLTWGLSDRYTWITEQSPRPDGAPVRPLPYDGDLKPTPAWQAIATAFNQASSR